MNKVLEFLEKILIHIMYTSGFFNLYRQVVFVNTGAALANGDVSIDVQLGSTNHWVVEKILAESTGAFDVKISRDDSQDNITDGQVSDTLLFEDAAAGRRTGGLDPFLVKSNTRLRFECTDTSGAGNNIELVAYCRAWPWKLPSAITKRI